MRKYKYQNHIVSILTDPEACQQLSRNPHPDAVNYSRKQASSYEPAARKIEDPIPEQIPWDWDDENPQAVEYLLQHPDKIDWETFSRSANPLAVEYLLQRPEKINWDWFSGNSNQQAVEYLLQTPEKIDWEFFSFNKNQHAVEYLLQRPEKINWDCLSSNQNQQAVEYLLQRPEKINWNIFIYNDNLTAETHTMYMMNKPEHIMKYPEYYDRYLYLGSNPIIFELYHQPKGAEMAYSAVIYKYHKYIDIILAGKYADLSLNPHPVAVNHLIQHPKKIDWELFSYNNNQQAVEYMFLENLLANPEIIGWEYFSRNENHQVVKYQLQHPEMIVWSLFVINENPQAVEYTLKHLWHIRYPPDEEPLNEDEMELEYLRQIQGGVDWPQLSGNENQQVVEYLLQHPEKINWHYFSYNENPQAVEYLLQHPEHLLQHHEYMLQIPEHLRQHHEYMLQQKINWWGFNKNKNPTTLEYLLQHPEHVELNQIASNPLLFELDYAAMSLIQTRRIEANLIAATYTPKRISLNLTNHLDSKLGFTFGTLLDYE